MFSDVSDISADVFLKLFGEHFFSFCKHAGYDTMLKTLGGNLVEFIGNLDALHSYLALSYQVCVCVISFQFGSTANRHIFSTAVYYFDYPVRLRKMSLASSPVLCTSHLFKIRGPCVSLFNLLLNIRIITGNTGT